MSNVTKRRVGRKRDLSRNASFLQVSLDILAEVSYERMTINKARHRLSRTGNRQLNAALHRIALTLKRTGNPGDSDVPWVWRCRHTWFQATG